MWYNIYAADIFDLHIVSVQGEAQSGVVKVGGQEIGHINAIVQ